MKTFVITINCDNAAYSDGALEDALADNLQQISEQLFWGKHEGLVQDYNGNTVGKYFFKIE